ncbi:G protein-coupled receptor GPR1 [Neolecta irregularis DAH-3]|uniref:G protein-coupled receptor GPR1 n=1 Tax=Neolecta irregularis (strain DAH-3) TaxID=1198029 RepID=A0A1U7LTA8_NEOID|nr:G protein-coupled receptor GPR1 [Neolecta irregularis DAH-3]|eukprot:OLL25751.1 G protein-coupled receptor GPR1 [Neolecta irregularis DAH-3]
MASLGFLTPTKGYVPLCYLPSRPLTWRMSLSWGPRYFIFAFITVLYIAIYVYIRRKFKFIAKDLEIPHADSSDSFALNPHSSTPPVRMQSFRKSNRVLFARANQSKQIPDRQSFEDDGIENPQIAALKNSSREGQPSFQQRKQMVSRQLRLLFVYPMVYIIIWIVPFAHHISQYDDDTFRDPIFGLACAAAFLIPLQGFINVCVYARNEKPWKVSPDGRRPSDTSFSPQNNNTIKLQILNRGFRNWVSSTLANDAFIRLEIQEAEPTTLQNK